MGHAHYMSPAELKSAAKLMKKYNRLIGDATANDERRQLLQIEYKVRWNPDADWRDVNYPQWNWAEAEYREKVYRAYRPFDYESIKALIGCYVYAKKDGELFHLQGASDKDVRLSNRMCTRVRIVTYENLLDKYTFSNNEPAGVKND